MNGFDALIIGGGPAGCACAIELASSGLKVLVIEKTARPAHKVCGEFISADSISLLQYLGVDIFASGANATTHLTVSRRSYFAETRLPFRAAALSRHVLDETLLERALSSGVQVARGEMAREIAAATGGVRVRTANATHFGRFAAVATGKHAMPGIDRPRSRIVGFKMLLQPGVAQASALQGRVLLSLYKGGYQGLQMIEGQQAALCWIVDRQDAGELGHDWTKHRQFLSRQSGSVAELLMDGEPMMSRPISVAGLPFGFLRRHAPSDRIFAIGDQLGMIPSFAGDGIAIALGSGILAARALLDGSAPVRFHHDMFRSLRRQFLLARPAHSAMTKSAAQTIGIGLLKLFPGLMRTVASATRFDTSLLGQGRGDRY